MVRATALGFAPSLAESVVLGVAPVTHDLVLSRRVSRLSAVVVTPGTLQAGDGDGASRQVLSRDDLLTRPQLAEDVFRALNRLPGFSGSDFSAQLRVRNSAADEVLYLLDGMELIEPYHMKDFEGSITIVDQEVVGRVDLNTGGFGVQFGNRSAGVVRLTSVDALPSGAHVTAGLSLANLRLGASGAIARGRGRWMLSARRGYLDVILRMIGESDSFDPSFHDVFGKIQFELSTNHEVGLHTLVASDNLAFAVDDGETLANGRYGNSYLWATVRSRWSPRLHSTTLASLTSLDWNRDGREAEFFNSRALTRAAFRDRRALDVLGAKQDWTFDATSYLSIAAGGEARSEHADYDYRAHSVERTLLNQSPVVRDSTAIAVQRDASGIRTSGYLAARLRPLRYLTIETGVRSDHHGWTGGGSVTPRLSALVDISPRTRMRASWGQYAQAHALQDLAVVDGESQFAPTERSEQRIVSAEHDTRQGWSIRVEAFERRIRNARPRYLNTDGELDPFPEGQLDRMRFDPESGRIRGGEVLATYDVGGRARATIWYAHLRGSVQVNGVTTSRPFEERHGGAVDMAWRTPSGWSYAAAWSFRSGWPNVSATFRIDTLGAGHFDIVRQPPAPFFTDRLEAYHRLDVRVSRRFALRNGALSMYAEVFNLLGRKNQRGWSYDAVTRSGRLSVERTREAFIGRLPTAGLRWAF